MTPSKFLNADLLYPTIIGLLGQYIPNRDSVCIEVKS